MQRSYHPTEEEYAPRVADDLSAPLYTRHFSQAAAEAVYLLRVTNEPLVALRALSTIESEARKVMAEMVREAREQGRTWEEISEALGVSRQAVQARFGRNAEK